MTGVKTLRTLHVAAVICLTALIGLCLAWELWLAPLRPGGSWLVLKVLPLLVPLRGILHARLATLRWAALLMVAYFLEGTVRAYADAGLSQQLAAAETALALAFFAAAFAFVQISVARRSKAPHAASPSR
jgi:uncharacterized membrane protein